MNRVEHIPWINNLSLQKSLNIPVAPTHQKLGPLRHDPQRNFLPTDAQNLLPVHADQFSITRDFLMLGS
jgi:hypothetical protein